MDPKTRFIRLLVPLLAGAALLLGPTAALADKRDFTLVNNSSSILVMAYVAPSEDTNWGDDILDDDVLYPGDTWDVSFSRFDPGFCLYDVKVVSKTGAEGVIYKVNLCRVDTVTFN